MLPDAIIEPFRKSAGQHGISSDEFDRAMRFMIRCTYKTFLVSGYGEYAKPTYQIISNDLVIISEDEIEMTAWINDNIKNYDVVHVKDVRFVRIVEPKELMLFKLRWV